MSEGGIDLYTLRDLESGDTPDILRQVSTFLSAAGYTLHPETGEHPDSQLSIATMPEPLSRVNNIPLVIAGGYDFMETLNPFPESFDPKNITLESTVGGFTRQTDEIHRSTDGNVTYIRTVRFVPTETDEGEPMSKELAYTTGRSVAVYAEDPHRAVDYPKGVPLFSLVFVGSYLDRMDAPGFDGEGSPEISRRTVKALTVYGRNQAPDSTVTWAYVGSSE